MRTISDKIPIIMRGISKAINSEFKKNGIHYTYSGILSDLYYGEGFYINHNKKVFNPIKIWGFDKNWAYGGALKEFILPLSSEVTDNINEAQSVDGKYLSFHIVTFDEIKTRYKDFLYTIYQKIIAFDPITKNKIAMMTDIDFEIFKDMYILTNLSIRKTYYFKRIGHLGINRLVEEYYIKKKNDIEENKPAYEAGFYGLFAKQLYKKVYANYRDKLEYIKAYAVTGNKYPRDKRVPIALWQTAYLRYEEWKQFKKHMKNIVYMNTDSVYMDEDIFIEDKPRVIGHYKREYQGDIIYFIRRNAYVVLDKDYNVVKSVVGGVINGGDLDRDKILELLSLRTVKANTYDTAGDIVNIDLRPLFRLSYLGLDYSEGDLI